MKAKTVQSFQFGDYFDAVHKGGNSTFYTATLSVEAANIICQDMTIENSAGPVGQALAISVSGDRCQLLNCRILGNQDSFFATGASTRVYVRDCYIEGTTDFIFGDATVLFSSCQIFGKSDSYISAASTNKGQSYGFVFDHCKITAAPGVTKLLLGRTWRAHAKTVYLYCQMGHFIAPKGWDNWRDPQNEKTAFYAEYKSTGAGALPNRRVKWAHALTKTEAEIYTFKNIFQAATSWIPSLASK